MVKKLGAGGMGEVFLAEDTRLARKVALKVLPEEFTKDDERLRRFTQEAKAASALNHPNIITIYDIGQENGVHYIATEHIEGETLRQRMTRSLMGIADVLDVAIQIASALSAAHQAGIVHRDIKPENVMLRPDGYVKVLDFGLAKLADRPASSTDTQAPTIARVDTQPGIVLGTIKYMSPEQARGLAVDGRSDIFSFGVLIYEIVSGRPTFGGETVADTLVSILEHHPPPLTHHAPDTPAELERIVSKCLSKQTERRYQSTQELLSDLKNLASARPKDVPSGTPAVSIAVLPFANMSADAENEYFCDGLAEELLNALSKLEGLRVAARTSAFSFKGKEADIREIGQKLNVSYVLEGSVRKSGGRLRITAQLISVSDGYHLWSERYDRNMEDVFEIQDEISLAIVDALKVKLLGEEKATLLRRYTDDAEVYQLYLKGRYYFYKQTQEGFKKAIEYYEQALDKEPNYAPAYAELANVYGTLLYFGFLSKDEALPKASAALEKALAIDPGLAEAHLILAKKKLHFEWEWAAAEQEFKRALELNPNLAEAHLFYAFYLGDMERFDEAVVEGQKAQALDPLSLHINWGLGFIFLQARRHNDALEQGRKLLEMEQNFFGGHSLIGTIHYLRGEYEDAIAECRKALALGGGPTVLASLGYIYGISSRPDDALQVIEELREVRRQGYVPSSSIAMVYAGLGDKDKAFEWLERAYEEHDGSMASLRVNSALDGLRSDPRFQDLLSRVGLPQ